VYEAGDPTLFHASGKPIVGTPGCSRFFIIGKLEVDDPAALAKALTGLRQDLFTDPYFVGVESFRPERKKTALLFHAKDDLPEVRYRVLNLLRSAGKALPLPSSIHSLLWGKRRRFGYVAAAIRPWPLPPT